jgi:hypothetical protein
VSLCEAMSLATLVNMRYKHMYMLMSKYITYVAQITSSTQNEEGERHWGRLENGSEDLHHLGKVLAAPNCLVLIR